LGKQSINGEVKKSLLSTDEWDSKIISTVTYNSIHKLY
jgi:hypothetical protein